MRKSQVSTLNAALLVICTSAWTCHAAQDAPELETLAVLDEAPGNITVTPTGTVVLSIHPSMPSEHLALGISNGAAEPFPDETLSARENIGTGNGMNPVLAMRADRNGLVWMLATGSAPHLYAWNPATQMMVHDFTFEGARVGFNDIALALDHGVVFLTDTTNTALVALDVATGTFTSRLMRHPSMMAEDIVATIDGKVLGNNGSGGAFNPMQGGLNPVTIDSAEEWIYYGPMSGTTVYRVRVADLLDSSIDEETLASRVEAYAQKTVSAGITIDDAGNVYVTDIQNHAIGVATPGQDYRVLVRDDERLAWADGISVGPDGYIYTASNKLYRNFASHSDAGRSSPPYFVTRFRALAGTTVGR